MRATFFFAGLVATVAAEVITLTQTQDITITSCGPTVTDCPGAKPTGGAGWGNWDQVDSSDVTTTTSEKKPETTSSVVHPSSSATTTVKHPETSATSVHPVPTATTTFASTWNVWITSTTTVKPVPTTTSWGQWNEPGCPTYTATGPPAWFSDLPSQVASSMGAKWTAGPPADWCSYTYSTAKPTTYYPTGKVPAGPSGTGGYKPTTTVDNIPKWTGAANANTGSLAFAGLAAAAALVFA